LGARGRGASRRLKLGSLALRVLDNFDSYECRGRNRVRGATLSEHGRADAIDVRLFKLADGRSLTLTDVNVDKAWRETIKASVCARFSTVLGPGSDGNHEEHIHLDLAERRNNYKLCEWDVRVPIAQAERAEPKPTRIVAKITEPVPLPRSRPGSANYRAGQRHWRVRVPRWRSHMDQRPWLRRSEVDHDG
jgi:hypothetical protein